MVLRGGTHNDKAGEERSARTGTYPWDERCKIGWLLKLEHTFADRAFVLQFQGHALFWLTFHISVCFGAIEQISESLSFHFINLFRNIHQYNNNLA